MGGVFCFEWNADDGMRGTTGVKWNADDGIQRMNRISNLTTE